MKIKSIFKKALLFSLLGVGIVNCGSKKNQRENDVVLSSYRLIDEQRTDEAIQLLENSLVQDPGNYEYKAVLASAYAHKGGIKIQKLVPIFSQIKDLTQKVDKKHQEIQEKKSRSEKINSATMEVAALISQFAVFLEVYGMIPIVDKNQSTYINHAIYLLNELGTQIRPEDVLYRTVLEVVSLKYILSDEMAEEVIASQTKVEQKCSFNPASLNRVIVKAGKILIDIYNDIGFVNPKQAEDMRAKSEATTQAITDITSATTSVTGLDEAAKMFLEQTILQNGFGKIIKCGGN